MRGRIARLTYCIRLDARLQFLDFVLIFILFISKAKKKKKKKKSVYTPCYFSPLSEIPGSIELLENSLTYEGVQWRKIVECIIHAIHFKVEDSDLDY